MQSMPLIHIAVTHGKQRLEINGTLELFRKFVSIGLETGATVHNPAPQPDPIITASQP